MDTRRFARSGLGSVSHAVIVSSSVCHAVWAQKKHSSYNIVAVYVAKKKKQHKKRGMSLFGKHNNNNNNGWPDCVDHELNRLLDLHVYFADMHH